MYHTIVKRVAIKNFERVNAHDYGAILKDCAADIHHRFGGHHALGGERQISLDVISPTTFVRSVYFYDPDGICLEFASWTRELDPKIDATHEPVGADGKKRARVLEPAE